MHNLCSLVHVQSQVFGKQCSRADLVLDVSGSVGVFQSVEGLHEVPEEKRATHRKYLPSAAAMRYNATHAS